MTRCVKRQRNQPTRSSPSRSRPMDNSLWPRAIGGNAIRIYDTGTLAAVSVRLAAGDWAPDTRVITYSPDGRLFAAGDAGGTVRPSGRRNR